MIDALTSRVTPLGVYVLHVAIEAAELGQELRLVHESLRVFHVDLDSGALIEAPVRIVLRILNCLAEQVVVFHPFLRLVLHIRLFAAASRDHHVEGLLLEKTLIVPFREEEDLDRQQACQQS